jgi:predicted nuclease of predicted toxin-antitoxin system
VRFLVDHCVPANVARCLTHEGHEAWTAREAHLEDVEDDHLIAYAEDKRAIVVATNRDCAQLGRRQRPASGIWLQVLEVDAVDAVRRALVWLSSNKLPDGMVLRVPKNAPPKILQPRR